MSSMFHLFLYSWQQMILWSLFVAGLANFLWAHTIDESTFRTGYPVNMLFDCNFTMLTNDTYLVLPFLVVTHWKSPNISPRP